MSTSSEEHREERARRIRQCDHTWVRDARQVRPGRGPGHPHGPAPPEYEQLPDKCKKCGASKAEVPPS
jgi:hypothetical protein